MVAQEPEVQVQTQHRRKQLGLLGLPHVHDQMEPDHAVSSRDFGIPDGPVLRGYPDHSFHQLRAFIPGRDPDLVDGLAQPVGLILQQITVMPFGIPVQRRHQTVAHERRRVDVEMNVVDDIEDLPLPGIGESGRQGPYLSVHNVRSRIMDVAHRLVDVVVHPFLQTEH